MRTVLHTKTKRDTAKTASASLVWVAFWLALLAALCYLAIQFSLLAVGNLEPSEKPAAIVYFAAGGYLVGAVLILARRRWLWIRGVVINGLVILIFYLAYIRRPPVLLSPGGILTKLAELSLEACLVALLATTWHRSLGNTAPRDQGGAS